MDTVLAVSVGAALLVGMAGALVTRIPGVPLSWTATLVWAAIDGGAIAWSVLALATILAIANYLIQHRMAGGAWSELTVADRSWIVGAVAGVAGLVVAKLPGLIFGFVGGMYIAERHRLRVHGAARNAADRPGIDRAAVLSRVRLTELATAATIGAAWLFAFAG